MDRHTARVKEVLAQQITKLEDAKGRLVRTRCSDGCAVLVFDDGQWACLTIRYEYEDHLVELSKNPPDIYYLWIAELLTNYEYGEQVDQSKFYNLEQQELSDKKQLQRLQAKYGK